MLETKRNFKGGGGGHTITRLGNETQTSGGIYISKDSKFTAGLSPPAFHFKLCQQGNSMHKQRFLQGSLVTRFVLLSEVNR